MMAAGRIAKVYVFDAYGTLFDVHSAVARHRATIGPAADRLSELWRTKQLEYSWVRSLVGRYRDFWSLTEDALDFAAAKTGGIAPEARAALLEAYRALDPYPEVREVLGQLKARGAATAILSNGSPAMLEAGVSAAGIGDLLDDVLSVDELKVFKTDPRTYALATRRFEVAPGDVSFQSSNRWDIAGATAFGFRCAWINRASAPDEYRELAPDRTLRDLKGLLGASE
jgi:2-haloacid dehalogenase